MLSFVASAIAVPAQISGWQRISIISPWFLSGAGAVTVAFLAITVVAGRRRRWLRWTGSMLTVVCVVASSAAAINSHYAYLPNVASLVGWRSADQGSWATARLSGIHVSTGRPVTLRAHGSVVQVNIPGVQSGFHGRPAEVYLPPAWFLTPRPQLPVMVLLHGTPGTPEDWTRSSGVDEISDQWAARHGGVAPILVMPDINGSFLGDSECTDGTAGHVETYLAVDVPTWVSAHLGAATAASRWAIGGLSEGGTCAFDLALRHRDRWSTFLDFGGEDHISRAGGVLGLFPGSMSQRRELAASYDPGVLLRGFADPSSVQGWFEVGQNDGSTTSGVERLAAAAQARGMTVRLAVQAGGHHNWKVWRNCFTDSLPWAAARLQAGTGTLPRSANPNTRMVDPATALRSLAAAGATGHGPSLPAVGRRHRSARRSTANRALAPVAHALPFFQAGIPAVRRLPTNPMRATGSQTGASWASSW